jgi:uncharacterized repeat protein (TIGR02543 family)
MKKGIFVFFAVLTLFALAMMGCDSDSGSGSSTKVTLSPTTLSVEVGESKPITATTDPAGEIVTWSSSNTAVATVNPGGLVTGVSAGTATITATVKDGGKATCAVTVTAEASTDIKIEGDTLVHSPAKLVGSGAWGADLGTTNEDGSYTFDSTADQYNGGAALYNFPVPKAGDLWLLSDYDLFEIYLKIIDGKVDVIVKAANGGTPNTDLHPYPSGNRYPTFDSAVNNGEFTYLAVIEEGVNGIGFQRNRDGPATVAIEKVVYSKGTKFTVSFSGGDYTAMPAIDPIKVLKDKTVSASLLQRPRRPGYTFAGWFTAGNVEFNPTTAITADMELTAHWTEGEPVPTNMKLNLDKASWGTLPNVPSDWTVGSITWPTTYATTSYNNGVLTLTFTGLNRQRAIIPLSDEQVQELIWTPEGGVTFRIDGTVKKEDGTENPDFAGFRIHLCDPTVKDGWNGTDTGKQDPLNEHMVEYRPFSGNKSAATLGYFVIQAMFKDASGDSGSTATGFDNVVITINSITIEPGNTE